MFESLHLPINQVSFGQVSTALLRKCYEAGLAPNLFTIGQVDLSSQSIDKDFAAWIQTCINKSGKSHSRDMPVFKLWHILQSLESLSKDQCLFTFYELDQPTELELNILANNKKVCVSSSYTKQVFETFGLTNVELIPLFFDKFNFNKTNRAYHPDRIVFNITGKFEHRKRHLKAIRTWLSKYGNDQKYFLQCAIYNPHLKDEDNQKIVNEITQGNKFFNVNFLGRMQQNEAYNDFLNSGDIIIGASGAEGWGLPEFQSVCLGKHAVIMNAHSYKDWANQENSCLFEPNSKIPAYDNMFFKQGQEVNQGNIFDFDPDNFIDACERAIQRVENQKENSKGLELQEKFSIDNFFDNIKSLYANLYL
jgi:glycosyltransferase involved in cell wall biosynthesis